MTNLILFGFRGCGKTYFGRLLAEKLQRPFFDTDDLLVALDGKQLTPRAIHRAIGEKAFRALETQAILSLMHVERSVIALGGGAVLEEENVKLLQTMGRLIYLDAKFETVEPRVGPLKELYEQRKPIYESIPARRVSVEDPNIIEVLIRGI